MRNLLIFLGLFFAFQANAQDKGDVRFLVEVDNGYFEIVINDTMYLKKYRATLPVGHYTAKVWSPGYITTEVGFDVYKDSVTDKFVKMAISNERQAFEREYKDYRMAFHKSLTVPGTTTLALALVSSGLMIAAYDMKNKVQSDITLYHQAPTYNEAVLYKTRLLERNVKYNRRRVGFYTTLGLTAAALGTTIFTYTNFKRNYKEPQLNAESPFKDKFSWSFSPFGCRFTWKLG